MTALQTAVSLKEKFFGCMAGVYVGSAMGAPMEGYPYADVESQYGTLDSFVSYAHYGNDWQREPGTTEDGVERQKLFIYAIIEKQDRVNAEDVKQAWIDHMNPKAPGMISEPFESSLLAMAKAGVPAVDIGRHCDYSGVVSMARACHPLGLINAGDPKAAREDVFEVGQLYQTTNSKGIHWAGVTAVAVAEACKPEATVDTVIDAIRRLCDTDTKDNHVMGVVREIERGLDISAGAKDFRELRECFDEIYNGTGIPYSMSYANEIVTKGICIFNMVQGNLHDAIITGVNMGRDTDCVTAIAAGISGALTGGASLPAAWEKQCDHATTVNPYSCGSWSIRQCSDTLYDAFQKRMSNMQHYAELMGD
ncbi:MAG: ADP-ribosylglycohydrolase family protein [Planctomycetes bacterium]|nr:ADP-ribosylglycohydrolase family protein [Planctomycetota bacterium]